MADAADANIIREQWLGKVLVVLGPSLPSPHGDQSARWSAFAAGCMAWGCLPLYLGIAAVLVVAVRSTCPSRRVSIHKRPRMRLLACVICALCVAVVAAGLAFAQGLHHVSRVQDHLADMARRLRRVEDSTQKWRKLCKVARNILQHVPATSLRRRWVGANMRWLLEAEELLQRFPEQLLGTRGLVEDASAWWKKVPQYAVAGVLPFVMVALSCAEALRTMRLGPQCAWTRALHRLEVLVAVGSSVLVVCAASASYATLDVATAALCDSEDLAVIKCLDPNIDEFTFDVCYAYASETTPHYSKMAAQAAVAARPLKASLQWESVSSSLKFSTALWHVEALASLVQQARELWQAILDALDPHAVHATYRSAVSEICGDVVADLMAMAACWLVIGAVLLPALALLSMGAVDAASRDEESCIETELVAQSTVPASTPTSWAYPWPRT